MGTTISMDVSACVPTTPTTPTLEFEDALRQEVVLVPEDLTDIHIEAPPPATTDATDDPAIHNRYGKGKHWKRNLKKKQVSAEGAAPAQTERTIEERRQQVRPIIDRHRTSDECFLSGDPRVIQTTEPVYQDGRRRKNQNPIPGILS